MAKRSVVRSEAIEARIYQVRGQRVMLSPDLADLYGVEARVLVQAVKRNRERFPSDFLFQLTPTECKAMKLHVAGEWGGARRARPYAFTEQGVAMLSSVLNSPRAVRVNIEIMRVFVRVRKLLARRTDLARRLDDLESKCDHQFRVVFEAIRALLTEPSPGPAEPIGFRPPRRRS